MPENYKNPLAFFRVSGENRGCALQFSYSDKNCIFLEGAKQISVSKTDSGQTYGKYDWKNKISVKLELVDIGAILSVLSNREPSIDLFHKFADTSKSIKMAKVNNGFSIRVSASKENFVSLVLSNAEVCLIYAALSSAVWKMLKWDT